MVKKTTLIKERILQVAEYKGISKEKFIEGLGQSYNNYKGRSKNTSVSSEIIAEISTKYPDINLIWLLKGEGDMIITENEDEETENVYLKEKIILLEENRLISKEKISLLEKINIQAEEIIKLKEKNNVLKNELGLGNLVETQIEQTITK